MFFSLIPISCGFTVVWQRLLESVIVIIQLGEPEFELVPHLDHLLGPAAFKAKSGIVMVYVTIFLGLRQMTSAEI